MGRKHRRKSYRKNQETPRSRDGSSGPSRKPVKVVSKGSARVGTEQAIERILQSIPPSKDEKMVTQDQGSDQRGDSMTQAKKPEGRIRSDRIPIIYLTLDVKNRLDLYIELANGEISGFGRVERINGGKDLLVTDLYLLRQKCSGSDTVLSAESVNEFMVETIEADRDPAEMKLWWHSHVDMPCFWSGTDRRTIDEFDNDWMLSIVGNKQGHRWARLDIFSPFRARCGEEEEDLRPDIRILPPDGITIIVQPFGLEITPTPAQLQSLMYQIKPSQELREQITKEIDEKVTFLRPPHRPNMVTSKGGFLSPGRIFQGMAQGVMEGLGFDKMVRVGDQWKERPSWQQSQKTPPSTTSEDVEAQYDELMESLENDRRDGASQHNTPNSTTRSPVASQGPAVIDPDQHLSNNGSSPTFQIDPGERTKKIVEQAKANLLARQNSLKSEQETNPAPKETPQGSELTDSPPKTNDLRSRSRRKGP